jgi:hypothetical protein
MEIVKWIQKIFQKIKDGLRLRRVVRRLRKQGKVMCLKYHINSDIDRCAVCSVYNGKFGKCSNIKSS